VALVGREVIIARRGVGLMDVGHIGLTFVSVDLMGCESDRSDSRERESSGSGFQSGSHVGASHLVCIFIHILSYSSQNIYSHGVSLWRTSGRMPSRPWESM
jgi:hypothetical protein